MKLKDQLTAISQSFVVWSAVVTLAVEQLLIPNATCLNISYRGGHYPVSLWVALAVLIFSNLRAMVIGSSDARRFFATLPIRLRQSRYTT